MDKCQICGASFESPRTANLCGVCQCFVQDMGESWTNVQSVALENASQRELRYHIAPAYAIWVTSKGYAPSRIGMTLDGNGRWAFIG